MAARDESEDESDTESICSTLGATGPTLLLQEIVPQFSDTIQVKNLHPLIGEKEIRAMTRVPIVSCMFQVTGPSSNQVILKLSSPCDAHAAITSIDGKKLNGQVVSATLLHPTSLHPTPLETESKRLASSCTQAAILPSTLSSSNEKFIGSNSIKFLNAMEGYVMLNFLIILHMHLSTSTP